MTARLPSKGNSQGKMAMVVRSTLSLATLRQHEQHHAHGRVQQTDHQVEHHDQTEVHQVNAQLLANRHQEWAQEW
jgi:hypothetical protein